MSETKGAAMSETAVERRLREMADRAKVAHPYRFDAHDIDAGREAIALLGEPLTAAGWRARRAALLARCEGAK